MQSKSISRLLVSKKKFLPRSPRRGHNSTQSGATISNPRKLCGSKANFKAGSFHSGKSPRKNHPTVATTLTILGSLYSAQGRYFDAETPLRRSPFIRETVFGPDHTSVATSLNNLGLSYQSQGRYADAEPL